MTIQTPPLRRDARTASLQPPGLPCTELLLIEDDQGDAVLVEELLAADLHTRWSVTWVRTLAAAEQVLSAPRAKPALIVLDLHLPDGSGTDALARVLRLAPRAAVVVLTGMVDQDLGLAALGGGAQDYLVKGQVDEALLSRSLRFALERRRVEEAAHRRQQNLRLTRGLLPKPQLRTGSDVLWATRYRPGSDEVLGGDFFDLFERPDGTLRAIIGDVCGHGPDEAALGVSLRVAWRTLALAGVDAEHVLPLLDELLCSEREDADLFVTLSDVTCTPDRSSMVIRSCGHPPPLLIEGASVRPVRLEQGPPIGVFDDTSWPATVVPLPPQWALVLYTDGLVEGRDGEDRWGLDGLAAHAPGLVDGRRPVDLEGLVLGLAEEAVRRNRGPLHDDLAILALGTG